MPSDLARLLLPFTVPSEDRETALDRRMELAAIFCLAELERDKGGGLISKRPSEEISFIAEVCYPFWLVPWKKRTLLFDGLGITNHTLSFGILPDATVFIREIKGSSDNPEAYSNFLVHNLNYFKVIGEGQKTIKGLIVDQAFSKDFFSLLPKAKPIRKPPSDKVLLSPLMDRAAVEASLKELSNFRRALEEDVRSLQRIVKALIGATRKHINAINMEIEKTRRKYKNETASLKSKCMEKIEKESKEYSRKIAEVSEKTNRLIQELSERKLTLEMDRKRLVAYVEKHEKEAAAARSSGDKTEEERWKQKLEECKQEISVVDNKLEEVNKSIKDAESTRDLEISRIKSEYNSKVENIMADLKKLEAARDFKIQVSQQMVKSLEESTSAIINEINKLIELRNLSLSELEKIMHPMGKRKYTLVYLPFFFVCYKRGLEKRYVIFPPSIVNALNGIKKIKGAFRSFKVRMLLQEFSQSITNLLNRFVNLIERNPIFEDTVRNACVKMNILKKPCSEISEGLEGLFKEKWLSERELELLRECKNLH